MDARSFRHIVGQFATGVTVVATDAGGTIHAMTANSFTSLSLEPPLVLFCAGKQTKMCGRVRDAGRFSINILARDQQDISSYFAGAWKHPEPPPFAFETWEQMPRLVGCAAVLGCDLHAIHEGGDHWIVIGRVVTAVPAEKGRPPLVFFAGHYATLAETSPSA